MRRAAQEEDCREDNSTASLARRLLATAAAGSPCRRALNAVSDNASVRVLGIDLGMRRIGLAISDRSRTLARPLETLARGPSDRKAVQALVLAIERLAAEEDGLSAIVIGHPRRLDGSANEQTQQVERMVEALRRRTAIPLVLQDERLTSREADSRLAMSERDWRVRKRKLDAASAAVILQDYLDEHPRAGGAPLAG
jgi:putative Holliday junction resolvase